MKGRPLAAACVIAVLAGAGTARPATDDRPARPAFSREEWVELVRLYARGERAQAIAGLGAWSERDLVRQVVAVEQAARAAERCSKCPNPLDEIPLRAAVLLYWDRDRAEQTPPLPGEVEQPRRCPGLTAKLAARLARVVAARDAEGSAFARRFFRLVVLQCQDDACFFDGECWATDALATFPRDTGLLLARGSVREESATIGWNFPSWDASAKNSLAEADAIARREGFKKARQDFEEALAIDPRLSLGHLRLGRVLWRLGDREAAREHLEVARADANP